MNTIDIGGKAVSIRLTRRAEAALAASPGPLLAEMELYFSCLIRKAVRFRAFAGEEDAIPAAARLFVRFRPVVSRACGLKVADGPPPLEDLSLARADAYVPDWLHIDHRNGRWEGRFGYAAR